MGKLFEQQQDFDRATAAYRAALQKDPSRSDAYLRLAILHDRRGKFATSEEMYRKAIENSPGNANIFCCVGYSFYVQQRWQEAEINLRQAIAVNPHHQRAHNNLGMLLARTDRADEAMQQFQLAGCDHVDSLMNAGFAMTLDGRWDQARHNYQLALAYDPSFDDAKKALRDLDGTVVRLQERIDRTAIVTDAIANAGATAGQQLSLENTRPAEGLSDAVQLTSYEQPEQGTPNNPINTSSVPVESESIVDESGEEDSRAEDVIRQAPLLPADEQ